MNFNSIGLFILRMGLGLTMAYHHGLAKLLSFPEKMHSFSDPLGIGSTFSLTLIVTAEFFAALALVVGIFTRLAVVPLIIAMSVIIFVVLKKDPFSAKELPLIYLFGFLTLLFTGPGAYSLDSVFRKVK